MGTITSFYIGSENGTGREYHNEEEFFRALKDEIRTAEENGRTHFDITLEK